LICCCEVAEIAQLEDDLKELELTIERENEEHRDLMKEKAEEYVKTEEELTANNQEICTFTCAITALMTALL